jgi:hypothetical protein
MTERATRRVVVLASVVALLVGIAPAIHAAPGECTRVIGFSQTRNWFISGLFESIPGVPNAEWELLAVGGADLHVWADPASAAYSRRVESPCGIPPTRVFLHAAFSSFGTATDADIAATLSTAVANIRARWPTVTRVDVAPIVGGPGHTTCALTDTRNVDATFMHPRIDAAIALVVNGVDLVAGPDLLASACTDFTDGMGHLSTAGSAYVAGQVAQHYTAPTISGVAASVGVEGTTATVTWTTGLPASSRVDFGTDPGALSQTVSDGAFQTGHSIELSGLSPNTTYHFRVTSVTPAGGAATSPQPPLAPADFTTPGSVGDTSEVDFAAGELADTYVSDTGGGEVVLAPVAGSEFPGPDLAPGWSSVPLTGGAATATGGRLVVDGARAATDSFFGVGRSMEFVATFGGEPHQDAGLGQNLESESTEAWATFGTLDASDGLWARTNVLGETVNAPICPSPCALLGSDHRYRIDWTESTVDFLVDGAPVHSEPVAIAMDLRPVVVDLDVGGPAVDVDWLRLSPYAGSGAFTSRVLDAGATADWGSLRWDAQVPPGTGISLEVRTGDTPTPDGGWTGFIPVAASGDLIPGIGRYLQYRAQFVTALPDATPALEQVVATFEAADNPPGAVSFAQTTSEGVPVVLTLGGNDLDGDPLGFAVGTGPLNGTLGPISTPACSGTTCTAAVTYTPNANFDGTDQFTYTVSDGFATSAPATVELTVTPAPTAIAFRAASSSSTIGATSLAVPAPAGIQPGDVLIAVIAVRGNPTVTSSGWTLLLNTGSGIVMHEVTFVHVAGGAEPASYTWTFSVSQAAVGEIAAYSGVDPLHPVDVVAGQSNASSTQVTAPSITAAGGGEVLLGIFGLAATTTFAPPAQMLERGDLSTVGARRNLSLEIADEALLAAGATGTRVAVSTNAAVNVGQVVALRPA